MAASKPVALCTHLMPSGKLCRGIALRSERYCHSHIRNHRVHERERAQTEMLDNLFDKVQDMETPELLRLLHLKLERLTWLLNRFPDIRLLLTASMDRLLEEAAAESNAFPQSPQNLMPGLNPSGINTRVASLLKSIG